MHKTAVLNVVGLTPSLLGEHTPALNAWMQRTSAKALPIKAVTPAVTCTAQATYYTGAYPDQHGIVANGWYFRDDCEIKFWRQSNHLVQGQKIWDIARAADPNFTCCNMFGWFNMYSSCDFSVTPRPMYPADGRKLPDIYSYPAELRTELQLKLGQFPLFNFWGPTANIKSSQWIGDASRLVDERFNATLTFIYLPHLDYNLQRLGPREPKIAADVWAIDAICGELIEHFERRGARVIVLSEYGITEVSAPIHLNRIFRHHGLIAVREELGHELLDAGASAAFAVADHQIAHIYVNDVSRLAEVRQLVESTPGVERVLDEEGKQHYRLDHSRSGELVAISRPDAWFTYYYWLDDARAPDFSRTVDIHRKPGYDPVELFLDPKLRFAKAKIGFTLAKKMLGFRYLMEVISLDATLVKGSHGRVTSDPTEGPLVISSQPELLPSASSIAAGDICGLVLRHL